MVIEEVMLAAVFFNIWPDIPSDPEALETSEEDNKVITSSSEQNISGGGSTYSRLDLGAKGGWEVLKQEAKKKKEFSKVGLLNWSLSNNTITQSATMYVLYLHNLSLNLFVTIIVFQYKSSMFALPTSD